jgi:sigma-B regulation protein RsbU (phosphoserine phosphatase)
MSKLLVVSGPKTGSTIVLKDGLIIGRGQKADVRFIDDSLSRQHAKLAFVKGSWEISDLGSSNGTFVNGDPVVTAQSLRNGDEVRLGELLLRFYLDQESAETDVDVTWQADGDRVEILENVAVDDRITPLLPDGLEHTASQLMIKRLRLLSDVADFLGNVIEADQLFPKVLDKLLDAFPEAERGCIMLSDPDGSNLHHVAASARPWANSQISVSRTLAQQVIATRSAVLSADVSGDERFDSLHTMVRYGLRTVMCAPMICEDTVLGLIQLDSSNPRNRFSKADMAVFLGIAGHTALALGKARLHEQLLNQRLLEKDLQLAEQIQHCFLPKASPEIPGYRFAESYSAAQHIGGDYYDFVEMPDNAVGLAVGDVSGKGVAAALYMAKLSSEMRFHARGRPSAGSILTALNCTLTEEMAGGMFVTLALLVLDPEIQRLTVSSAGHLPPIIRSRDGSVRELKVSGNIPLGILEDVTYSETGCGLKSGDWVIVYTDGVTEAMNAKGEMFGTKRLKQRIATGSDTPAALLAGIKKAVAEHIAGFPQSDDLTMVCLAVD